MDTSTRERTEDISLRLIEQMERVAAGNPEGAAKLLRTTAEIRRRARLLLESARAGRSAHFTVDDQALAPAADAIADAVRERHPHHARDGIPQHSWWRHLSAGGVDRLALLDGLLGPAGPAARARAQVDLAVVGVLLGAGAGPDWSYREASTGQRLRRSEGLAVATFHAFAAGLFSSDPARRLQADAVGLRVLVTENLAAALQAAPDNPLVGVEGRAMLLRRLGETMTGQPETFGEAGCPSGLFDLLTETERPGIAPTAEVSAHDILSTLLVTLAPIWPSANAIGREALGDCWRLPAACGPGLSDGWMPLHLLSQWLACSLIEPFSRAGVPVRGIEVLTGLPEQRNGGLLLDAGVLRMRDAQAASRERTGHRPGDALIVEWRALTVALLDELAPLVGARLGLDADRTPAACMLEGASRAAGRTMAQRLRGGAPPLALRSDGTVF